MSTPSSCETCVFGNVVGDYGGSDLVHFQAAVGFWNLDAAQPQLAGFFQQLAHYREILVLHLFDIWDDFVLSKLLGGLSDQTMLFAEIFWREYFLCLACFKQETPTRDFGRSRVGDCGHRNEQGAARLLRSRLGGVPSSWFTRARLRVYRHTGAFASDRRIYTELIGESNCT